MASPVCEEAIRTCLAHGRALLKFLSPNDCGATSTHQAGYLLPRSGEVWRLFTPHPPLKGSLRKHEVRITWQDGRTTDSVITWYGKETRSEYRLTRFGRDFPWRDADLVGALLVLVPTSPSAFHAFVLELEDDIAELQAALGVEVFDRWTVFDSTGQEEPESEDQCIDRLFRAFAATVRAMPSGGELSAKARDSLNQCVENLRDRPLDDQLLEWVKGEYRLFRLIERQVCQPLVARLFASIDDFLKTAMTIIQRRKSRAGRSLENHFAHLLHESSVPFDARVRVDNTLPDILIPGKKQYDDPAFPERKLIVVGVKTTCKDRWRQVLSEAPRVKKKHILTIQEGISARQLGEMQRSRVSLVVPRGLHDKYPSESPLALMDIGGFISFVRSQLAL